MFFPTFNRNLPPRSLKKKTVINIEPPKFFKMQNGLKVLVVENHKLPLVRIGLELDYHPFLEKDKAGIKKVFGKMLRSGTKNHSKEELDEIIDYIGTTLYTSFSGISISTLKKYLEKSISIMSDILLNSQFDNFKELEKIIKQKIIDINLSEKDPNAILQRVRNVLYFGKNHPYGEYETYDTIKNITLNDLKKLYHKYYIPNISYLSFIGDISQEEAKKLCDHYFSKWKKGSCSQEQEQKRMNVSNHNTNTIEIDMVDIPSLTQSTICFGKPVPFRKNDPTYFSSILANGILGGGPQSRLFLNLREKKAYTYGAYSILKSDKNIGYFSVYTQVSNGVTDKAIKDILKVIVTITENKVSSEELNIKKKEICGQFILDLEDPNRISDLFISELKNNLPSGFYKNYLNSIRSVTISDIYYSCKKFFSVKNGRILIIGRENDVLPNLKKLGYPIRFFDKFGQILK
ncbi:M16 family peptidase [Blattabacterium sp. (Mastotermes darwiniensis) str. MADAR]|uniref:M16 family metallopeptidase n=1 Tax=Blattabacterium sp. (Mastotermes darwiniensis) TaxID=39768 RepID=UPI000231DF60|nr:pitrilysin family protein [Blattabacterium sp. (Mastotermes darwiniensis)]AER40376.1 M16 family peptidase [Blattabacterium sp. (Mastotermes darwiniensis) str. MADAR]